MGDKSKIEWTSATWNPVVGCSIVSPGCTNCYAMKEARRLELAYNMKKYAGLTTIVNGNPVWTGTVRLHEDALSQPMRWRAPRLIFVNSMSDLHHEALRFDQIDQVVRVMAATPQHTYQILTKRGAGMQAYWSDPELAERIGASVPLPNVWLGVSAERQEEADERIPHLLKTPAAVRFISAEPLLRPITFNRPLGIDWIIAGGESGPNARPMHPNWVRWIRDQATRNGVKFFFKQWGEWKPCTTLKVSKEHGYFDDPGQFHRVRNWGEVHGKLHTHHVMERVGKKAAGRLLDGRTWDEFPTIKSSVGEAA